MTHHLQASALPLQPPLSRQLLIGQHPWLPLIYKRGFNHLVLVLAVASLVLTSWIFWNYGWSLSVYQITSFGQWAYHIYYFPKNSMIGEMLPTLSVFTPKKMSKATANRSSRGIFDPANSSSSSSCRNRPSATCKAWNLGILVRMSKTCLWANSQKQLIDDCKIVM